MQKGILLNTLDTELKTVNNAIIQLGDIDDTGKGRHFVSRFIKDGLVKIEGHGIVLIQKPTIDMSLQSMIGAPVFIKHQDVTEENADELRCGVISKAYFNDFDGWYYCEGVIWDKKAQKLIEKGWSVSCSYDFLSYKDDKGVENNIPYDKEFTSLNFTHLALVNNPRYERANIVFNSKTVIENWNESDHPRDEQDKFTEKGGVQRYLDEGWQATTYFKNGGTSRKDVGFKLYKGDINAFGLDEGDIDISGEDFEEFNRQKKIRDKGHDYDIIKLKDNSGKEYYELKRNGKFLARDYDKFKIQKYIDERMDEQIEDYWKNKANNSKEKEMSLIDEIKKLISRVENEKGEQDMDEKEKVDNENVDKRKLIDEVAGIMKSAGCDDEDIRTAIGKMEKIGYDKSEAGSADNKKVKNEEPDKKEEKKEDVDNKCKNEEDKKEEKVDNEDDKDKVEEIEEEVKEDVDNKCKNSKSNTFSFDKINEIYNSVKQIAQESDYVTRQQKLDNAVEYFK